MDNELFELCKDVYERTGWDRFKLPTGQEQWIRDAWWTLEGTQMPQPVDRYKLMEEQFVCPLYTSDYLLEKLPKTIPPFEDNDWVLNMEADPWFFTYIDQQDNLENSNYGNLYPGFKRSELSSDTPLKALLKLTIALDDAGVKL